MNDWNGFYGSRVNSTYQDYFEKRYHLFLEFIKAQNNDYIIEMGCGIGSVSKALLKDGYTCEGFDLCEKMVELSNENTNSDKFKKGDIFQIKIPVDVIGVSHGVLEHFSDKQIKNICESNKGSIHYVPLDKYVTPSFGDERLLSYQHWIDLINPSEFLLFNDGFDFCFKV